MADQARTRSSRVDEGYSGNVVLFSFMNQSRFQIMMTTNLRPRGLRLISDNLFRLSFQIVNPEIIKPELDRGWTLLSQYSLLPHDSFIDSLIPSSIHRRYYVSPLGAQRRASPAFGPTEQDVPVRGPVTSPATSSDRISPFSQFFWRKLSGTPTDHAMARHRRKLA